MGKYDLDLGKWGADINTATCDVRLFKNVVEDWGNETIKDKWALSQFKLLEKYKSICFHGDDEVTESFGCLFCIIEDNLKWTKRSKGIESDWRVLVRKASCVEDAGEDSGEDCMSYQINEALHAMIAAASAPT